MESFTDGTSNTLFIVEAGDPVPWTKPEEPLFDPHQPLPTLRCVFHDGFRVCWADGSRGFIRKDIDEETFRSLITRNGGELIDASRFR